MIKTYQITTPLRNSSFVLRGKTNNSMRYNFSGGDPLIGKPATLMLRSKYAQDLLEGSDVFAKGFVKIMRVDDGGEQVKEAPVEKFVMEEVTSPEQLIEFVGTTLEKAYKDPKAALRYAERLNYEFPNLVIE